MNITNVVLDRSEYIVTYDTASKTDLWDRVCWVTEAKRWECIDAHNHSEEIDKAISKEPYINGSVEMPALGEYDVKVYAGPTTDQEPTPDYYNHEHKGLKLDPYRICKIYSVVNPCQQHAIKKLLRGLNKGDVETPLELIESVEGILARWKEMIKEDAE